MICTEGVYTVKCIYRFRQNRMYFTQYYDKTDIDNTTIITQPQYTQTMIKQDNDTTQKY